MSGIFKLAFLLLIVACSSAFADPAKSELTQKSFVQLMFQRFGWSKGLPVESGDRDYLQVLSGKRTFKYEAESAYNSKTDRVTVRNFNLFGPFSGKGWILGVSENTGANFTIHLPLKGNYLLKAVIKGKGFIWYAGDNKYVANSKSDQFQEIVVGQLGLDAGIVDIRVTIPPEGALDSFSLSAPDYLPIQPLAGWRFKERLTALQLAEIVLSIKGEYEKLPSLSGNDSKRILIADSSYQPTNVFPTSGTEFGSYLSSKWLRSDFRGGNIKLPLQVGEIGYYEIYANLMGGAIAGDVNGYPFSVNAKPYFDNIRLGMFRLESGDNFITINLPPLAGIDSVGIKPKDTKNDDILVLAGIKGPKDRIVSPEEAEAVLKGIVEAKLVDR